MQRNDMEIEIFSEIERREHRRHRRIRSQRLAYAALIIVILLLIGGMAGGLFFLNKKIKEKKEKRTEEILQTEEISEEAVEEEMDEWILEEEAEEVLSLETTREDVLDEVVESVISEMSLEEKVSGLFIVTPESITGVGTALQAGEGTKKALEQYPVGGLIYFKKNITSKDQITKMIENSKTYCKYPLFIGVDEEGGSVSRLAEALKLDNVGSMAEIGSSGEAAKVYDAMNTVGGYLAEHGFNLDFAPVADVLLKDESPIGDRAFGSDAEMVAGMVESAMSGLKDAGITSCVKHFPGIGDSAKDTHEGLVVVEKSLEELRQTELIPFIRAIENGVPMIMVGHISLPQIVGDNTPATMSKEIISDLLRSEMGFNGVVITDAMNRGAIKEYYSADEAAIRAFKAGADMVLMPEDFEVAYKGVIAAVQDGTISEERINDSLKRVYRIKYADSVGE